MNISQIIAFGLLAFIITFIYFFLVMTRRIQRRIQQETKKSNNTQRIPMYPHDLYIKDIKERNK